MKKQLGLVAVMAMMSVFAVSANSTGAVATGAVATGAVATGAVVTGAVATGAVATGAVVTGAVATGAVATGAVATGAVATGAVATGTVATGMTVEEKTAKVHGILDEFFKKNSKRSSEKKSFIAGLVATLKDAEAKLEKRFESFKADYALVISALENYKI